MTDKSPEEQQITMDARASSLAHIHAAIELLRQQNLVSALVLAGAGEGILPSTDNPHFRQKLKAWQEKFPPNHEGTRGLNDFINWAKHGNNDGLPPNAVISQLEVMVVIQRAISKFAAIYDYQTPEMKRFNDWAIRRLQPEQKSAKSQKLKARLPRGLADRGPAEIAATREMVETIRVAFERYGFEPVETPAIEYTDALGKFLPDQDRPNEGVFSFQDDDEQWLSLRYDLTAPLARYVAERIGTERITLPYRSYRFGYVYRNEKPGPGRFRQFMQFDADTVGAPTMAADAELCMLAADTMEALGIPRGQYVVKVNNRKLLDGIMETIGLEGEWNSERRLNALRALDKYDRLGEEGVRALLGQGRRDESSDFSKGVGLDEDQIAHLMMLFELNPQSDNNYLSDENDSAFVDVQLDHSGRFVRKIYADFAPGRLPIDNQATLDLFSSWVGQSTKIDAALRELSEIAALVKAARYGSKRIMIDPSVVRGLEYYTGPVFEVELLIETRDEKGRPVRFGSVGGGGRYDGLISRFSGQSVPATGFSIGVSRLQTALSTLSKLSGKREDGPVVVTIFDRDRISDYQRIVAQLRKANICAELYLGNPKNNIRAQLKYADERGSVCAVIQGSDERTQGIVQIRDLLLGRQLAEVAKLESDREEYLKRQAMAQFAVKESDLVDAVRKLLARHAIG